MADAGDDALDGIVIETDDHGGSTIVAATLPALIRALTPIEYSDDLL